LINQTKSKQKESWPLLILGGGFLLAIIAFAAIYVAFNANDSVLIQSYVQQLSFSEIKQNEVFSIYAAPGNITNLKVNIARSIKGLWCSEGISLAIKDLQDGTVLTSEQIVREKNWQEVTQHSLLERSDPVQIDVKFQIPSDVKPGTDLSGFITGQVTYPSKKINEKQKDVTQVVSIALKVIVISPEELAAKVRNTAKITIWVTSPISLAMIIFFVIYNKKIKSS